MRGWTNHLMMMLLAEGQPLYALPVFGALLIAIGIGWYLLRGRRTAAPMRPCPSCGQQVIVGMLDCPYCEFDFRTVGSSAVSPRSPNDD